VPGSLGLLAQQDDSERGRRPPVPSLKNLKKIKRPAGRKSGVKRTDSRMKPVKPTLRPRTGRPKPALDRDQVRNPSRSDRGSRAAQATDRRRGSTAGRKSGRDSDRRSATAADDSRAADPAGPAGPGSGADMTPPVRDQDRRCRPLPPRIKVRMNFNEAEVLEIVQWISEQTCKNFIIGDGIRGGKITILSNTPVTANEAYRAFLSALNVNNMTVVRVGRFYKVQMKRDASKDTIPTYVGEDADMPHLDMMVTRLLQLDYVDANQVNGTVKQLVSKDGDAFPYAPTNSLIISDTASNMHRILEIIEQLDTPLGQEEIRVIQVEYALATELATTMEEIFAERGGSAAGSKSGRAHRLRPKSRQAQDEADEEPGVSISKIIADERTNQLIVVGTPRSFPRLQELIDKLDVPIPGEGQIQVVYLEHSDAEELANTLTSLAQGSGGTTRRTRKGKKGGSGAQAAELFQGEVKVTADKATNSLVIVANQNDYRSLQKVIKKLDIKRRQVFVEAVIMEVNMDTTKDVGLAFHTGAAAKIGGDTVPLIFGTQFKTQGSNINSLSVAGNLSMLGFLSGLRGPDLEGTESILGSIALPSFGVVLQALQTDSNVDVLSTPHILTSDNEEAEIMVGENIPIPAGYGGGMGNLAGLASMARGTQGRTGTGAYNQAGLGMLGGLGGLGYGMGYGMGAINRQEVGLTLKIKPQINEGDFIRMEIEEEQSEVKDTSNPLGPTTTKRSAKTVVVVKDQQTVVVGGLMRDKVDMGESKIPVLGDIPVIGWLFRTKRQQKTKTNLLLFLTPYIIESQKDFQVIFERKMRERREFMERFYGKGRDYKAFIDFRRKRGPLADMHQQLSEEMAKLENGGQGVGSEVLITPEGSGDGQAPETAGAAEQPPAADSPAGGEPAGDAEPQPTGERSDEDTGRLRVE
jgi:general secretion pathway protein D